MTVKELITQLLDCDLNAMVGIITSNKDSNGKSYIFEFTGIKHQPIWDSQECKTIQYLMFRDWRFDGDEDDE